VYFREPILYEIMKIPFNKPWFAGHEIQHIVNAAYSGHISGNGAYTKKCHSLFEQRYGIPKCFLTTSCTDAFEMACLLIDFKPGDEVIMPSFTFVSTANPFLLRGASIRFADSSAAHPNIDVQGIEELISPATKAIVVVHYAGVAVDMDAIMQLASKHNLVVIEDAAHAIEATYNGKALGSIGHFGMFSFHETKNISTGEGGMLAINDPKYIRRAEIIWEKGTDRAAFFRGETDKYGWVDVGSSFLPSDIIAGVLYGQMQQVDEIQNKRISIWKRYHQNLKPLADMGFFSLPEIPEFAVNNGHMFYLVLPDEQKRNDLIDYLNANMVQSVFHYLPLHKSRFFEPYHDGRVLPHAERFAVTLLRLPFFYELPLTIVDMICDRIRLFFVGTQ
jgi:dTDP-4-amino-4,6-dideoxygalactose transaminase